MSEENKTFGQPAQLPNGGNQNEYYHVNFFSTEGTFLVIMTLLIILTKRLRPIVVSFLKSEARYSEMNKVVIRDSLITLSAITGAKSCVLLKFQNGVLDEEGFHLLRVSVLEEVSPQGNNKSWCMPKGKVVKISEAPKPVRELLDLSHCLSGSDNCWIPTREIGGKHERGRQIIRFVCAGNTPIGAVCLSFQGGDGRRIFYEEEVKMELVEKTFENISAILKSNLDKRERGNLERGILSLIIKEVED